MARRTKQEVVDSIAKKAGLSKTDADGALDAAISTIQEALSKGDEVALIGFGTFEVRKRAARTGRNPQTGAAIKIKAKKVPAFKPGKALRDAV